MTVIGTIKVVICTTLRLVPVDKIVSAAEANRKFSFVLNQVKHGDSYIVTSHGKSIAKIVPFAGGDPLASTAKSTLLARLKSQPAKRIGRWTRDELYDNK